MLSILSSDLQREHIRSAPSGLEFVWVSPDGTQTIQSRPDDPGNGPQYLWPKDTVLPVGVPRNIVVEWFGIDPCAMSCDTFLVQLLIGGGAEATFVVVGRD